MIRAVLALKRLRERENYRYLNASPEEKERIKEEWGIIHNPTEEKLKFRQYWCESAYKAGVVPIIFVTGMISSFAGGLTTLYYTKPDPKYLSGLVPAVATAVIIGGIYYVSSKIGDLLHRRQHPTGRECNNEHVQRNLEYIAEIENEHRR